MRGVASAGRAVATPLAPGSRKSGTARFALVNELSVPLDRTPTATRDPLGRALHIVRWLVEEAGPSGAGVREIAKAVGLQPSSVSRLLAQLKEEQYVRRDASSGRFLPGIELMRLGALAISRLDIGVVAEPYLRSLGASINETVFLALYDHRRHEMIRIQSVPSSHPLQYTIELNRWTEIFRGSSGLAILAFLPEDERDAVIELAEAAATPETPWLRRAAMLAMLDDIRARGYASTHGRRVPGAVGMAAPLFGPRGTVLGSVIVTVPEFRFTPEDESRIAGPLMRAAAQISSEVGGQLSGARTEER